MSLRPAEIAPVPTATAQVAAAAFPKGCPAMRLRDKLGAVYDDRMFASLYPARGQPAHSPWRLALVTLLQFAGGLSDRQAADAVRGRIDWKYALSLELTEPRVRLLRSMRVPRPPGRGQARAGPARCDAGAVARARPAQGAGASAHGQHPRAGCGARGQPAGERGRDAARGAERLG